MTHQNLTRQRQTDLFLVHLLPKAEAVYPTEYDSFEEVVSDLPGFIENIYNAKRLHSALGYLSPNKYEEINARTWSKTAA